MLELVLPVLLWYHWEDEEEGRILLILLERRLSPEGQVALLERGKFPQSPIWLQDRGHRALPVWPISATTPDSNTPPHPLLSRLPPQGQGYSLTPAQQHPSSSQSPCPSSTVTWATQVNAWLYLMDAVSHGDSDVRRARPPPPCPPSLSPSASPGGVWSWSGDFCADNLLGAPPSRPERGKPERTRHPVWRTWVYASSD